MAQPVGQQTQPDGSARVRHGRITTSGPGRAYRAAFPLCLLILLGTGFYLLAVPFRSSANYIDWVTGAWIGLLLGASEGRLVVSKLQELRSGSVVRLPLGRGLPRGMAGGPALLALLGAGYAVLVLLPGPVASLDHTLLFTFNTICGAWWTMWVVYLGALLSWTFWRGWKGGRPLKVQFV